MHACFCIPILYTIKFLPKQLTKNSLLQAIAGRHLLLIFMILIISQLFDFIVKLFVQFICYDTSFFLFEQPFSWMLIKKSQKVENIYKPAKAKSRGHAQKTF